MPAWSGGPFHLLRSLPVLKSHRCLQQPRPSRCLARRAFASCLLTLLSPLVASLPNRYSLRLQPVHPLTSFFSSSFFIPHSLRRFFFHREKRGLLLSNLILFPCRFLNSRFALSPPIPGRPCLLRYNISASLLFLTPRSLNLEQALVHLPVTLPDPHRTVSSSSSRVSDLCVCLPSLTASLQNCCAIE